VLLINQNAVYWAHLLALGLIVMPNALRAQIRINLVDLLTLRNGIIRALWLAYITIDALICNKKRHVFLLISSKLSKIKGRDYSTDQLSGSLILSKM